MDTYLVLIGVPIRSINIANNCAGNFNTSMLQEPANVYATSGYKLASLLMSVHVCYIPSIVYRVCGAG